MPSLEPSGIPELNASSPFNCEFCLELNSPQNSRFRDIYGPKVADRVVLDVTDFVAWPTLGQIVRGSVLLLPKKHVEMFADLPLAQLEAAQRLVEVLCTRLDSATRPLVFEHGARSASGGGCGIYHGHVHVVPYSQSLPSEEILPANAYVASSLLEAWHTVIGSKEYLIARGTDGIVRYTTDDGIRRSGIKSQHVRCLLVNRLGLQRPWDWRQYISPEKFLLETLEIFRGKHVPQRR